MIGKYNIYLERFLNLYQYHFMLQNLYQKVWFKQESLIYKRDILLHQQ